MRRRIKLLVVKDLNAHYGKIHILQGVNLEIQKSDFIGLIGRNGVGKTTTLKLSLIHISEPTRQP